MLPAIKIFIEKKTNSILFMGEAGFDSLITHHCYLMRKFSLLDQHSLENTQRAE
jgi:hypothetical protein